ncbi:MAG: hypothetical protein K0R13_3651 [Propionibacteriaceae bacterium]|nr:hypothetical protein [Propionibacteriaceae bacterium]
MIDFQARLPKDEAALVIAAIRTAKDQFGPPLAKPNQCGDAQQEATSGVGVYSNVDGLLDVARGFSTRLRRIVPVRTAPWWWCTSWRRTWPETFPQERLRQLRLIGSVSAETSTTPECDGNVLAVTPAAAVCHIAGVGSVEPATAQRHAWDSALLGAVIDKHGKVLALGRTRRLVSKAQRRALLIRDQMCRYRGCHQTRHLKAHRVVPWILGGRTDLDKSLLPYPYHMTYGDRTQDHYGARVLASQPGQVRPGALHRRAAQRERGGR